MFVNFIDSSNVVKRSEKLFEMFDVLVEKIEDNVVQVITNNGSNYMLANKLSNFFISFNKSTSKNILNSSSAY